MAAASRKTPLAEKLATRIAKDGPITFAAYMEACLYDPEFGYYADTKRTQRADYYTSVELHPVFGRLLARQLEEMWRAMDRPTQFIAAELGAGNGLLASQILDFCSAQLREFYVALRYLAVERSAARREAQAELLSAHLATSHIESRESLTQEISAGCILSNEFFDALPVHRVVVRSGEMKEIFVGFDGRNFVEALRPPSYPEIAEYFAKFGITLRENQQAEAGLEPCRTMQEAAARLQRGFLLTVDYGHDARELYNERHMRGTMLAYRGHAANENFYEAPGEQDLTAHVNFTALELAGRESGAAIVGEVSQTQFLLALARANNFADLHDANHDEVGNLKGRLKFKTLIHPEGMGETFRVQTQQKGIGAARLTGLDPL